jgi:hypothetical protein
MTTSAALRSSPTAAAITGTSPAPRMSASTAPFGPEAWICWPSSQWAVIPLAL